MGKYPDVYEFAQEWARYVYNFSYLDLIIGITCWDEYPEVHKPPYIRKDFTECDTFYEDIEEGIWVNDRKVEIINKEETVKIYKKYEKLYQEDNRLIYFPGYYDEFQPDIVKLDYLKRILETYNITDAEKFLKEHFKPYELETIIKF